MANNSGQAPSMEPAEVPPGMLQDLMDMGFERNISVRALYYTKARNTDSAITWIMENMDKPGQNEPLFVSKDNANAAQLANSSAATPAAPVANFDFSSMFGDVSMDAMVAALAGGTAEAKAKNSSSMVAGDSDSGTSGDDSSDDESERFKQVIVINKGLRMKTGKIAAQAAHAALAAYKVAAQPSAFGSSLTPEQATEWTIALAAWESSGTKKVVVSAANDAEMDRLYQAARAAGLPAYQVRDAGHTQVARGSKTALAVGPARSDKIDAITGTLKLL